MTIRLSDERIFRNELCFAQDCILLVNGILLLLHGMSPEFIPERRNDLAGKSIVFL
jgi:hypothetical protein